MLIDLKKFHNTENMAMLVCCFVALQRLYKGHNSTDLSMVSFMACAISLLLELLEILILSILVDKGYPCLSCGRQRSIISLLFDHSLVEACHWRSISWTVLTCLRSSASSSAMLMTVSNYVTLAAVVWLSMNYLGLFIWTYDINYSSLK